MATLQHYAIVYLCMHANGLRPYIKNWYQVAMAFRIRVRNELRLNPVYNQLLARERTFSKELELQRHATIGQREGGDMKAPATGSGGASGCPTQTE